MDLENRVDKIDEKLENIALSVAKLEVMFAERNKLFGKSTVKLLVVVAFALLTAMGYTAAASVDIDKIDAVDAGVLSIDAGD